MIYLLYTFDIYTIEKTALLARHDLRETYIPQLSAIDTNGLPLTRDLMEIQDTWQIIIDECTCYEQQYEDALAHTTKMLFNLVCLPPKSKITKIVSVKSDLRSTYGESNVRGSFQGAADSKLRHAKHPTLPIAFISSLSYATVHVLFPHLPFNESPSGTGHKFTAMTSLQMACWLDDVVLKAIYEIYPADVTQTIPRKFRGAQAVASAQQKEKLKDGYPGLLHQTDGQYISTFRLSRSALESDERIDQPGPSIDRLP